MDYVTGARWRDLPRAEPFASKSSAHRWLLQWQRDGTWQKILEKLLRIAAYKKLIDPERLLVDGTFSPWETGRPRGRPWIQRQGQPLHMITDGEGRPLGIQLTSAKGNEHEQVVRLIEQVGFLLPEDEIIFFEADKGDDSNNLRLNLLHEGIYPLIPYRGNRGSIASWVRRVRWKVERAISWIKRGYRRVATRWERLTDAYTGIVTLALCYFWARKIVG